MTTDIKLTPSSVAAFTEALKGESGSLDAWLEVNDESEVAAHIEAYASACVARATAQLQTEIDALRTRLEDTVRESTNNIEALRAEVERANSWNERVSVCRDHVADIVDGLCVICSLHAAEERADNLQADVKSLQTLRDVVIENHGYWKCRAERLVEALREYGLPLTGDDRSDEWEFGTEAVAREKRRLAALHPTSTQEGKESFWPKLPDSGEPDWTGHD